MKEQTKYYHCKQHDIKVKASSKSQAWMMIRNYCKDYKLAVPQLGEIEEEILNVKTVEV